MRPATNDRDAVLLADGRRLTYAETGPRDGVPVIYCHGAIGTPLGGSVDLDAIAWDLGIRHIAVSRPGIGGSDPDPDRTVLSFAADLRQLADSLELERFSLIGVSAGGPYALGVAHALGSRVERVAVCSSLSPLCAPHRTPGMQRRIRLALACVARAPALCGAVGDSALPLIRRHPALLSRVIAAHAAPGERAQLQQSGVRGAAAASFLEPSSDGVRGMIDDYLTYSHGWGFDVSDVRAPVRLWHGVDDPLVPIEHALQLAAALPNCHVFFDADEGHHFFRRRLREILTVLVGQPEQVGSRGATSLQRAREIVAMRRYSGEHASREGRAVSGASPRGAATADAEPVGRRLRKAA
jgi:pimeloyl-ACP methyl ester carboxylesterase